MAMQIENSSLGNFKYDDEMFEVVDCDVSSLDPDVRKKLNVVFPEGVPVPGKIKFLSYVGPEPVERGKVKIPDGVKNLDLTFATCDIKSVPLIPDSVESMNGTFACCDTLKKFDCSLPRRLTSMVACFYGCESMKRGPNVVPSTTEDVSFAFAGCGLLEDPPRFNRGLKRANGSFVNCYSLEKKPCFPSTVVESVGATAGCYTLDDISSVEDDSRFMKERAKMVSDYNRSIKSVKNNSGFMRGLSFAMQSDMFKKMGMGGIGGIMTLIEMRRRGTMDTGLAGALYAHSASKGDGKKPPNMLLMRGMAGRDRAREEKAKQMTSVAMSRIGAFDAAHSSGVTGESSSRIIDSSIARATTDINSGLLISASGYTDERLQALAKLKYGKPYEALESKLNVRGSLTSGRTLNAVSREYLDQLRETTAYYASARSMILSDRSYSEVQRKTMLEGLDKLVKTDVGTWCDSANRVQSRYALFNEGDLRQISNMLETWRRPDGEPEFNIGDGGFGSGVSASDRTRAFVGSLRDSLTYDPSPDL